MSKNCIFCDIINKKSPAGVLFENDLVISFLDIRPVNEGHALVIPKEHVQRVEDISSEAVYTELFKVGKKIQLLLQDKLSDITGFNYLIANGEDAGQEIFHVHLHIIPRKKNDGFGFKFGPNYGKILTPEVISDLRQKILN